MLKIAWSKIYNHPLPAHHRFPMVKYDLLPEQLIYEGSISESSLFEAPPLSTNEILSTHTSSYWNQLSNLSLDKKAIRKTGFPLSKALVHREIVIAKGTMMAAEYALEHGVSFNVAGGTHHAYTDHGEGFCLLNDMAIASNHLIEKHQFQKILFVDLDVHQGNGSAEIFGENSKVFTFSMHGEKNYPLKKEKSDLDIGLADGTDDKSYLTLLDFQLKKLVDKLEPDFIFYQAGVDVLKTDKLGRLGLSIDGCKKRDEMVLSICKRDNIPVTVVMGGGYSEQLSVIIEAHSNTYRLAQNIYF